MSVSQSFEFGWLTSKIQFVFSLIIFFFWYCCSFAVVCALDQCSFDRSRILWITLEIARIQTLSFCNILNSKTKVTEARQFQVKFWRIWIFRIVSAFDLQPLASIIAILRRAIRNSLFSAFLNASISWHISHSVCVSDFYLSNSLRIISEITAVIAVRQNLPNEKKCNWTSCFGMKFKLRCALMIFVLWTLVQFPREKERLRFIWTQLIFDSVQQEWWSCEQTKRAKFPKQSHLTSFSSEWAAKWWNKWHQSEQWINRINGR